jgi:hypothetical protein
MTRGGPDARAEDIVQGLCEQSPEFARLWSVHEVAVRAVDHKTISHPELGAIELDCQKLFTQNQAQAPPVFTASPGTEAYEKPQLLFTVGTGRFAPDTAKEGRDLSLP